MLLAGCETAPVFAGVEVYPNNGPVMSYKHEKVFPAAAWISSARTTLPSHALHETKERDLGATTPYVTDVQYNIYILRLYETFRMFSHP